MLKKPLLFIYKTVVRNIKKAMSIKEQKEIIRKIFNRYSKINENTVEELFEISKIQSLKKGELLLSIGQVSKEIHILTKGIIVSYFLDSDGNQYHKNIFTENNFVGSTVSALTKTPSNFALEVIENSEIISFNYQKFNSLIQSNLDLKNFYIAYLEKNWVIDKEKREIDIVMKSTESRYLEFLKENPQIDKRVPLQIIASHLGITPTQLSRIRKKNIRQSTYVE